MPCTKKVYVVDSCSLIWLTRHSEQGDLLFGVWDWLEELVDNGRFFSCREVGRELKSYRKQDFLRKWVIAHPRVFVDVSETQLDLQIQLAREHPRDRDFWETKFYADIPLVALAIELDKLTTSDEIYEECVVVSEESGNGLASIPGKCKKYGITVIRASRFLNQEGYKP